MFPTGEGFPKLLAEVGGYPCLEVRDRDISAAGNTCGVEFTVVVMFPAPTTDRTKVWNGVTGGGVSLDESDDFENMRISGGAVV